MATRVLESRFETMSVNDENCDGTKSYTKQACWHRPVIVATTLANT